LPRCRILADISCDVGGGIEVNDHTTDPADPVYVWDVATGATAPGVAGNGPIVLAVDNLPCELPRESSAEFGAHLSRFLPEIAKADLTRPLDDTGLPVEVRRGVIAHRGELTPAFAYLREPLDRAAR
jgi:alpha-aminoadipic semialdehyde synthase